MTGLTDASGNRTAAYYYDPYGQLTSSSGTGAATNPFRFAGGYQDPTGLYHFGQRYYDPSLGRWTQQDSLSHIGDLNQADRYAFVGGDPVDPVDLGGASFLDTALIVTGFALGGAALVVGLAGPDEIAAGLAVAGVAVDGLGVACVITQDVNGCTGP